MAKTTFNAMEKKLTAIEADLTRALEACQTLSTMGNELAKTLRSLQHMVRTTAKLPRGRASVKGLEPIIKSADKCITLLGSIREHCSELQPK